jgi:type I restriction enzyme, S subunit
MISNKIKLGKIATFRNGLNFKSDSRGLGCKIIGVPDFGDRLMPDYNSLTEINTDGIVKAEDYLKAGDILFVRSNGNKNLVGRSLFIDKIKQDLVYSGFCIRARFDNSKVDPLFYAYFFKTQLFRQIIASHAGGANIQNLNQGTLDRTIVPYPPFEIQKKISSILFNYDELIEINISRIKLLEELAQRTYEEWFVKFRVNGEQLLIDDITGLPSGWKKEKLKFFFDVKTGKKDANFGTDDGRFPFFTCSQEPIKSPSYSFDAAAILLAGNGEFNVKTYRGKFEAYQRTYVLIPFDEQNFTLIHRSIQRNLRFLTVGSKGAVIKYLTKDMIENFEIIYPTVKILRSFNEVTIPAMIQMENLLRQVQLLKESRDILLPRLMNGSITVNASVEELFA